MTATTLYTASSTSTPTPAAPTASHPTDGAYRERPAEPGAGGPLQARCSGGTTGTAAAGGRTGLRAGIKMAAGRLVSAPLGLGKGISASAAAVLGSRLGISPAPEQRQLRSPPSHLGCPPPALYV